MELYDRKSKVKLPRLKKGTLVRHIAYKLPQLDGTLSASPRNLYHYLHCSMFDPILPFRVIDLRETDPAKHKDELVKAVSEDFSGRSRHETLLVEWARSSLHLLRGGVVGVHLPALTAEIVPVTPGDTLILATDGVRSDFSNERLPQQDPPPKLADYILARWGTQNDDALVLVVRYLGLAT